MVLVGIVWCAFNTLVFIRAKWLILRNRNLQRKLLQYQNKLPGGLYNLSLISGEYPGNRGRMHTLPCDRGFSTESRGVFAQQPAGIIWFGINSGERNVERLDQEINTLQDYGRPFHRSHAWISPPGGARGFQPLGTCPADVHICRRLCAPDLCNLDATPARAYRAGIIPVRIRRMRSGSATGAAGIAVSREGSGVITDCTFREQT